MDLRRIGGLLVLLVTFTLVGSSSAWATNGYQLIGVGSYQKGMAGATTAAPHDAMCALSNPAGMALIGSRADFNMEMFNPNRRADLSSFGGAANEGGSRLYGVPAIGWTAPAFNRTDVYFGGGMYGTSGLGVDYDVFNAGAFGQADIYTAIQFWKMAPTVAGRVTDRLTLGVALNADYQSVEINEAFRGITLVGAPSVVSLNLSRSPGTFGLGTTIGAMYKVSDRVDVGFAYSSQQYFQNTEYRLPSGAVTNFPQATGTATNASAGRFDLDMNFPQQWALGVAARPVDRWLVSFDLKWINWAATHDSVKLKGTFGLDTNGDGVADVFNNLAFPAVVEDHLTLGATYRFGDHWEMSGAYKKAFKNELTGTNDLPAPFPTMLGTPSSNAKISMDQHSVGMQISYRF
jgi:long-chain fatty acid transport protein